MSAGHVVHRVNSPTFRKAVGGAIIRGICGRVAKSITLRNEQTTCVRCRSILFDTSGLKERR